MFIQKTIKPRNHLSILANSRKAGVHGKTKKAQRRQNKVELKKNLI